MLRFCKKPTCSAWRGDQLRKDELVIPSSLARRGSTHPRGPTLLRCCQKPAQCTGEIIVEAKAGDTSIAPEPFEEEPLSEQTVKQPILAAPSSSCRCLAGLLALFRAHHGARAAPVEGAPQSRGGAACQDSASKPTEAKAVPPRTAESTDGGSAVRPALGGRWVLARFEGDMEQLLVDAGLPWAIRRLAKSLGYGVGNSFVTISLDGDSIEMVTELPTRAPCKTDFVVGRLDWHETVSSGGSPQLVKASWKGEALAIERQTLSGKDLPAVRYRLNLETGELVEEVALSTGGTMLRFFGKQ